MGYFPTLYTVTFSKDRPWQLKEHLRTYYQYRCADQEGDYYPFFRHIVIFSSSPENYSYYADLMIRYAGQVCFIPDNYSGANFKKILRTVFNHINTHTPADVLFTVDDVLFYDYFTIRRMPNVITSLRLHMGCHYCQPAGNVRNHMPMLQQESGYQSFTYVPGGFGDWYYPYEVSASVYGVQSRAWEKLLQIVNDPESIIRHPNDLEAQWSMTATERERVVILDKPCCCTVTVNRVQDDYKNPIGSVELTQSMARLFYEGNREYNEQQYKDAGYNAIHVTDLWMKGL